MNFSCDDYYVTHLVPDLHTVAFVLTSRGRLIFSVCISHNFVYGFFFSIWKSKTNVLWICKYLMHDGVIVAAAKLLNNVLESRLYFVAVFNTANAIANVFVRNNYSLRQTLDKR